MTARDTITRERTENTAGWRYEIQHGPDGETSYAWVYDDQNAMVCTAKTHHAIAIVQRMNAAAGYRIVGPADMEKAVPAGWVLVPEKPTEAMTNAYFETRDYMWPKSYRAMLASRPKGGA